MKKILFVTLLIVFCLPLFVNAEIKPITLEWTGSDFRVDGTVSDSSKSGYNLYYTEKGATEKILFGTVDMNTTTFTKDMEFPLNVDFYATAFNQFGESDYSDPAIARTPDKPTGLRAWFQQIISWLKNWKENWKEKWS